MDFTFPKRDKPLKSKQGITKKKFIMFLIFLNVFIVFVSAIALHIFYEFMDTNLSYDSQANVLGENTNVENSLLLELRELDEGLFIVTSIDINKLSVFRFIDNLNYQRILDFENINHEYPLDSQVVLNNQNEIFFVDRVFDKDFVSKYSLSGNRTEIFSTSNKIISINYIDQDLYILVYKENNEGLVNLYTIYQLDSNLKKTMIGEFEFEKGIFYFSQQDTFMNSDYLYFSNNGSSVCYYVDLKEFEKIETENTQAENLIENSTNIKNEKSQNKKNIELINEINCLEIYQTQAQKDYVILTDYQKTSNYENNNTDNDKFSDDDLPESFPDSFDNPESYPMFDFYQMIYDRYKYNKYLNDYEKFEQEEIDPNMEKIDVPEMPEPLFNGKFNYSHKILSEFNLKDNIYFQNDDEFDNLIILAQDKNTNHRQIISLDVNDEVEFVNFPLTDRVDYLGEKQKRFETYFKLIEFTRQRKVYNFYAFSAQKKLLYRYVLPECNLSSYGCDFEVL